MPNLHKVKNTVAIVVAHGKSELIMSQYIKSNLRLPIEIYSEKNGRQNIQIESLLRVLEKGDFSTFNKFINYYPVEVEKKQIKGCKLFPIMDWDNCNKELYEEYKSGEMFKNIWLAPYIVPIWSYPNLDEVLCSCGIIDKKPSDRNKGSDYQRIFPIHRGELDIIQVEKLRDSLKKCNKTNLDVFLDYCLSNVN